MFSLQFIGFLSFSGLWGNELFSATCQENVLTHLSNSKDMDQSAHLCWLIWSLLFAVVIQDCRHGRRLRLGRYAGLFRQCFSTRHKVFFLWLDVYYMWTDLLYVCDAALVKIRFSKTDLFENAPKIGLIQTISNGYVIRVLLFLSLLTVSLYLWIFAMFGILKSGWIGVIWK